MQTECMQMCSCRTKPFGHERMQSILLHPAASQRRPALCSTSVTIWEWPADKVHVQGYLTTGRDDSLIITADPVWGLLISGAQLACLAAVPMA